MRSMTEGMTEHYVALLQSLIAAGVVVVDGDDRHHANVRGLGGAGGSYVKSLGGDYDTEYSSPPTFSHGEDNGTWRVLAVRPDVFDAATAPAAPPPTTSRGSAPRR